MTAAEKHVWRVAFATAFPPEQKGSYLGASAAIVAAVRVANETVAAFRRVDDIACMHNQNPKLVEMWREAIDAE